MNQCDKIFDSPPPIFRRFALFELNGYKNISLTCNSPVKIACAENGSGKTSLLNALHSIFVGQPSVLYGMDFQSLEIEWADSKTSKWKKSELFGGLKKNDLEQMARERFFVQWGVEEEEAIDLMTKFILNDIDEVVRTDAYQTIYRDSPYDRQDIFDQLSAIADPLIQSGAFSSLYKEAQEALNGAAVLYLPTYRRIEADIPEFRAPRQNGNGNPSLRSRNRVTKSVWDSTKLIYFGMGDVEARLMSIIAQIRKETLEAYSRSNGQTLEELVGSDGGSDATLSESFDFSSIEVVLARVGKNSDELRQRLKIIIKNEEIYSEPRRELRRFLSQLLRVYAERREDEQAIENFVNLVNRYICPAEGDTLRPGEKKLTFDKLSLELAVKNQITGREVKFGALSSGEKQVVSIFARLMLDPKRKYLILIDEPELSLSLEWQQRFLPDIFSTANCLQLIAITHSPFIFDNEFAVAAGSIDVKYIPNEGRIYD